MGDDSKLEPKLFLNKQYISNIHFTDPMIKESDLEQSISSSNQAPCISRQKIVNHLKSDKFEFRKTVLDHENTYVSISDSIYQSLDKNNLKKEKLPCAVLVCNLLASHADTFRF